MTTTHDHGAYQAYETAILKTQGLLLELEEALDAYAAGALRERPNYGHVGTLNHINDRLAQALAAATGGEES